MNLRLVSQTTAPASRRRGRRKAGEAAVQLRAIECRPDLYERLRMSWERPSRLRMAPALLAAAAALAAFAFYWSSLLR